MSDPTKKRGSLSLVLPAHNEAENIEIVVQQVLEVVPNSFERVEVIIVDDGSKDSTGQIIDDLAIRDSRVRAIHHPRNRGYGAALSSGFSQATGDWIMFMDSDRQFDISDISRLLPFIESHEIVAGFRMERNDPLHRRVFAEMFNITVRILFGVHMRDIDCAFKIFQGDLIRSIELTAPGALINTEIQAKARRQGAKVQQVGVRHFPRVAGEPSGGSPRVIARAMRETVILWWQMRTYSPPSGRPNINGPYRLGDLVVAGGFSAAFAAFAGILGRLRK
jgi:glycosyltransferase involved in cell wall biosynthesis